MVLARHSPFLIISWTPGPAPAWPTRILETPMVKAFVLTAPCRDVPPPGCRSCLGPCQSTVSASTRPFELPMLSSSRIFFVTLMLRVCTAIVREKLPKHPWRRSAPCSISSKALLAKSVRFDLGLFGFGKVSYQVSEVRACMYTCTYIYDVNACMYVQVCMGDWIDMSVVQLCALG
jgi:hypothetical protein